MAERSMAWAKKTTGKTIELGGDVSRDNFERELADSPTENTVASILQPTDEGLQTAARLKILLGSGRVAAFAGLTPQDGVTPLLMQMGSALASIDPSPILLVDANSRAPMLHELAKVPRSPGFADCLSGACSLETTIRTTPLSNLFVLPFGESDSNLSLRLSTGEAEHIFQTIRQRYRYIFISAGVVLQTSESVMISSISDGVVIAMAAGKRRQHQLLECREALEGLKLRLLGVVLTKNSPPTRK